MFDKYMEFGMSGNEWGNCMTKKKKQKNKKRGYFEFMNLILF